MDLQWYKACEAHSIMSSCSDMFLLMEWLGGGGRGRKGVKRALIFFLSFHNHIYVASSLKRCNMPFFYNFRFIEMFTKGARACFHMELFTNGKTEQIWKKKMKKKKKVKSVSNEVYICDKTRVSVRPKVTIQL